MEVDFCSPRTYVDVVLAIDFELRSMIDPSKLNLSQFVIFGSIFNDMIEGWFYRPLSKYPFVLACEDELEANLFMYKSQGL